jgi:mRNA-degrading endonuclease RelE of RelBE toxin-antitoxin system
LITFRKAIDMIAESIIRFLKQDANIPTKRRKKLRPNDISEWELRLGKHRVFYDFEDDSIIKVVAVGYKEHNELLVRGKKVEL